MAISSKSSTILFLFSLNLVFFTLVSGHGQPPATCPRDTLKLGVCANLLNWFLNIHIGNPPSEPCCGLLQGLADLEAAACLCTSIKANVLGIIHIDIPLALSVLLNACGKNVPSGFQCA